MAAEVIFHRRVPMQHRVGQCDDDDDNDGDDDDENDVVNDDDD